MRTLGGSVTRRRFLQGTGLTVAAMGLGYPGLQPRVARAQPKGAVAVAISEDWQTMDPANHFFIAAFAVHPHFYDPLLEFDEQGRFTPMLAESWKNLDPKTWEFKLRKGVKFHNGEPFTAESVKFTLERIIDPKTRSAQASKSN